jgi:UDP-glucuronate decarboxylase
MQPDDGRVVTNFAMQALRNAPLAIFGDGRQTRSFCYVSDLVDGLIRLMESPDAVTGPVNLGNPVELTMLELARSIVELTGSTSPLRHCPLPADDPRQRRPDIDLAQRLLGWTPKVSLRDGLVATIAHLNASTLAAICRNRSDCDRNHQRGDGENDHEEINRPPGNRTIWS